MANKEKKAQSSNNRPYSGRRHSEPEKVYVDYMKEDPNLNERLGSDEEELNDDDIHLSKK